MFSDSYDGLVSVYKLGKYHLKLNRDNQRAISAEFRLANMLALLRANMLTKFIFKKQKQILSHIGTLDQV